LEIPQRSNCYAYSVVISQPDAALYIQLPTLATTVAIHSTVNAVCRKGLQAELGTSAAVLPGPGDPLLPHRLFYHPYAS
jgi:hypothetical protein